MSSRRTQSMPPATFEKIPTARSRCTSCICVSWKVFTCIISHVTLVTLVVAYCILGAFTFEHLEAENEKTVKMGISSMRGNVTEFIWQMTHKMPVLHQGNWTSSVVNRLQIFETEILTAMKTKGWDGNEDMKQIQWTFSGALFYSIIVITTIGYGHIAPKTHMGKVTTIFYAILGIPLMLLCLSNIGDIMASSFRFLYWRVCCFVCTREPKRAQSKRLRHGRGTIRQQRHSGRSHPNNSIRRSIRTSQRSADSGCDTFYERGLGHAYSDTELRYDGMAGDPVASAYYRQEREVGIDRDRNARSGHHRYGKDRDRERERYRDRHTVDRERMNNYDDDLQTEVPITRQRGRDRHDIASSRDMPPTTPRGARTSDNLLAIPSGHRGSQMGISRGQGMRAQSLDPRMRREAITTIEYSQQPDMTKTPVLCNRYALQEEVDSRRHRRPPPPPPGPHTQQHLMPPNIRSQSLPRHHPRHQQQQRLDPYDLDDPDIELQRIQRKSKRRERSVPPPSPRIMSPMGFAVHRQARHVAAVMDDDSLYEEEWGESSADLPPRARPVPIWLCVFLVISYIIAGAFLFSKWEQWSFLDSAYFCFITLTTIGFGDFVPAQGVKENSEVSIALCSLYLLFGIALLAMSFNLVQEEVIANVKSVARRLGILKEEEVVE